jgi:WD40 repeat protein
MQDPAAKSAVIEPLVIRMFVSSTFRDMHAERDYLNRFIFPELRSRCWQRGVEFLGVDLRWGITQQDAECRGALAICLEEIDRCLPFFVCLLGDRYGWVPPPDDIQYEFFEKIRSNATPRSEDVTKLNEWYRLDETHQPPVYRLLRERQVPTSVADNLVCFWEKVGLPHAGESITAREINHAISYGSKMHALFYLRKSGVQKHPDFPSSFNPIFVEQTPGRKKRLAQLKRSIYERFGSAVKEYTVHYDGLRIDPTFLPKDLSVREQESFQDGVIQPEEWAGLSRDIQMALEEHGTVALTGLDEWGKHVLEDLWAVIKKELKTIEAPLHSHHKELALHERFLTERTNFFYGREELLDRMLAYASDDMDRYPLVITGPPGCGKSALMAECALRCRTQLASTLVIPYFIGVAPGSTVLPEFIRSLCQILRQTCGLDDEIPADPGKLHRLLPIFLEKAGAKRQVVILLDALNQLDPSVQSHELYWFPFQVPNGTRVIVSTLANKCLDRLAHRIPPDHVVEVPALSRGDRESLVRDYLARRSKKLTPCQISRLLDTRTRPDAGLPLYVLVAIEELCLFGDYDALNKRIDSLPAMLPKLFDQVLDRLESDHGREQTELIMQWLAVSRSGLLETEILDLLETHKFEQGFQRIHWTRFYRAIESYLRRRDEDTGAGLLDFFHEQLRIAVYRRYFKMDTPESPPGDVFRDAHAQLAGYFLSIAYESDKLPKWRWDRPRGLSELSYHLAKGQLWEQLRETLMCFDFIRAKVQGFGIQKLIDDYDLVPVSGSYYSTNTVEELYLIQDTLQQSAHILEQDQTQLRSQLYGRLMIVKSPGIQALFKQIKQWDLTPWLRPLLPTLVAPGKLLRRILKGHSDRVTAVAVTPDGQRAVSASWDGTLRVWDLETGKELHILRGHSGMVNTVAITPDGGRAISGSRDKTLKVWNIETGMMLGTLQGHSAYITAAAVTPDGQWVVSASCDNTLKVWGLETGVELRTIKCSFDEVKAIAVTPDGRRVVSASKDHKITFDDTLEVWDLESGKRLCTLPNRLHYVLGLAVTPDGGRLISTSQDKTLKVWDLETNSELFSLSGHNEWVSSVAITPDGQRAVSGSWDKTLKVWDLEKGTELGTLPGHSSAVSGVAVTMNGQQAVSVSWDATLRVWNIPTRRDLIQGNRIESYALQPHPHSITAIAISPDGRKALSASYNDSTLKVWDLSMSTEPVTLKGHSQDIQAVVVTSDGRNAISASTNDNTLKVWDLDTCVQLRSIGTKNHSVSSKTMAVTPDGKRVVSISGSSPYSIKIWDIEKGTESCIPGAHHKYIYRVAITPNGQWAISASQDKTLKIYDLVTKNVLLTLPGHSGGVYDLAITPDGKWVVSASADKTLRVWDLQKGVEFCSLKGHLDKVYSVEITPEGRRAVSASADKTLKVWDLDSCTELRTLRGHSGSVRSVAITPDGKWVVSTSTDNTLKVWDLNSGQVVAGFSGEGTIMEFAIARDSRTLIAGDISGKVHFMRLEGVKK